MNESIETAPASPTPVSEGTPESGATELGPALRAIAVEVERADSSVRRELCAEMLRVLADNTPAHFIVNVGGEAAWSDDPDATAAPSTDAGAGATTYLTIGRGGDRVYCVGCKLWVATDGFCEGDPDTCAVGEEETSKRSPTLTEAQHAIDLLAKELSDLDDLASSQIATLHLQHTEQAAKLQELGGYVTVIFGADRLAGAVDRLVRSGKLDARSEAGDALLDYACSRHGDREPIMAVRCVYDVILSKLDAARSSPSGGEPT